MKISYKNADGKSIEIEVTEKVATFYLESVEAEKRSDRRETRRHTPLSAFNYEDMRLFADGTDMLSDLIHSDLIERAMGRLTERQRYLIQKCCLEGWSYTEIACCEGKDESAIRHAVERAKKKLFKFLT